MIAVDTNVLVYAHRRDLPQHERAAACVRALASGSDQWAIPWPCVHEFLAVVTNAKIFATPTPMTQALAQVSAWQASPRLTLLSEERGYIEVLERVLSTSAVTGARVHDARIAALALFHGVDELYTVDRDFGRFPEITTHNPLVESP